MPAVVPSEEVVIDIWAINATGEEQQIITSLTTTQCELPYNAEATSTKKSLTCDDGTQLYYTVTQWKELDKWNVEVASATLYDADDKVLINNIPHNYYCGWDICPATFKLIKWDNVYYINWSIGGGDVCQTETQEKWYDVLSKSVILTIDTNGGLLKIVNNKLNREISIIPQYIVGTEFDETIMSIRHKVTGIQIWWEQITYNPIWEYTNEACKPIAIPLSHTVDRENNSIEVTDLIEKKYILNIDTLDLVK